MRTTAHNLNIVGKLEDISLAIERLDHSDSTADVIRDCDFAKARIDELQSILEKLPFCNYMSRKSSREEAVGLYKRYAGEAELNEHGKLEVMK